MKKLIACSLLVLLLVPVSAWAACTGSGLAYTCAADSTAAQIMAAMSEATDGATISIAAGTWDPGDDVYFPTGKKINLIGNGIDSTVFTGNRSYLSYCTSGKGVRISGFTFTGDGTGSRIAIHLSGACNDIRIDHNKFLNFGSSWDAISFKSDTYGSGETLGLVDHNTFQTTGGATGFRAVVVGGWNDWASATLGSANAVFIEDNTFDYATANSGGGAVDAWYGGRYVFRHNTIVNSIVISHGECNTNHDTALQEIYNNTWTSNDGWQNTFLQGSGEAMVFNNALASTTASYLGLTHYRSYDATAAGCNKTRCDGGAASCTFGDGCTAPTETYYGWPCYRQPGRKGDNSPSPWYYWNNGTYAATVLVAYAGTPDPSTHVQNNRDFYASASGIQTNATTPFNGTSGTGWGTLANRPTTCTTTALTAGYGPGYFATDQGTQGTLYRCSATNTWTEQYQPYQYPHPLQGGAPATSQFGGITGVGIQIK
jgi:hypothetical protein